MKASDFLVQLNTLTREELISIKGIGDVLADNFIEFLDSARYQELIIGFIDLESKGKTVTITSSNNQSNQNLPLSGQLIVITGSFDVSRSKIKEMLENQGAKVTESVSNSTTLLIAGDKAGSKLSKAQSLGIPVLNNYMDMFKSIEPS